MLAGAEITNITLTVVDAVRDEEIPDADLPAVGCALLSNVSHHQADVDTCRDGRQIAKRAEFWAA